MFEQGLRSLFYEIKRIYPDLCLQPLRECEWCLVKPCLACALVQLPPQIILDASVTELMVHSLGLWMGWEADLFLSPFCLKQRGHTHADSSDGERVYNRNSMGYIVPF